MKFDCVVDRVETSAAAADIFRYMFLKSRHSYWLDSSRVDGTYARFSFMGDDSGPLAHILSYRVDEATMVQYSSGETTVHDDDIFTFLEAALAESSLSDPPALPFDFCGGYVGYLGYELMAVTEHVLGRRAALPDARLLFSDRFLAIDHMENVVYCVALHAGDLAGATAWLHGIARQLESLTATKPIPRRVELCPPHLIEPYLLHDKEHYLRNITLCREKIEAGESYEVCLTNRVRVPMSTTDSAQIFETYLTLRDINPAPYACYIKDEESSILCSSPERFLKIDQQGQVEARPIKGTMPRGLDPEHDEANKARLRGDRRFFSENLMIVDLLRNDLSRSCVPGTISVPALMKVESYATLHQLVSTIRGELQSSVSQCIARCFPGGSMTGAPKKRTLEIINDIEGVPRGVYSGTIGYLSLNGTANLNIVIRTIVIDKDYAEIGVGGAITYLSDPQQEYDEMILKAIAPFSAVAALRL